MKWITDGSWSCCETFGLFTFLILRKGKEFLLRWDPFNTPVPFLNLPHDEDGAHRTSSGDFFLLSVFFSLVFIYNIARRLFFSQLAICQRKHGGISFRRGGVVRPAAPRRCWKDERGPLSFEDGLLTEGPRALLSSWTPYSLSFAAGMLWQREEAECLWAILSRGIGNLGGRMSGQINVSFLEAGLFLITSHNQGFIICCE